MSKFIMTVGLPGSGKSYLAGKYVAEHDQSLVVSSDDIRYRLWGNAEDQQHPEVVFAEMERLTMEALDDGFAVIYDATNLNSRKRRALVGAVKAKHPDVRCVCWLVLCSITGCKKRNAERTRHVPDEVIDRMVRQFKVPYWNEGWDFIELIDNGPKQDIDREHTRLMSVDHDNPHHTTSSISAHCTKCLCVMTDLLEELGDESMPGHLLTEVAYQHDIGKRRCKTFTNTKGETTGIAHYYHHEQVGAYLWLTGDCRDQWGADSFLTIGLLIQLHMMPYAFPNRSKEELDKWCAKHGYSQSIADWTWMVHKADELAH